MSQSQSQSQSPDPKTYYGYLFESDKKPTPVLDALLRAIANHIVSFGPILRLLRDRADGCCRRATISGIKMRRRSRQRSWPAFTRLWEATTTVRHQHCPPFPPSHLLETDMLCYSALCRSTASLDIMDLCKHRVPAYSPAYERRFLPSIRPRSYHERLCAMAINRDTTRAGRTCTIYTNRSSKLRDQESG
jgi:hypothetical protein